MTSKTYRVSCSSRHTHYAAGREYLSRNGRKLSGWTFEIEVVEDPSFEEIVDGAIDERSFLDLMSRWGLEVR